ncbi:hypothetical protein HEK616_82740 (plasmid) [Streptomyces nigrescens]|uniref:Uncharacterized protein n=1 Tax=Streptomyces nigrescens TaxID=1920 RepID=A0ABM8A831_STRNI|nr:hypothetical protein HEK616_82740 [Streptomyces nigrescens]
MESGEVDGCGLLVAGGDSSPLLEAVDAPFDGVALPLGLAVESRRPAALAATSQSVSALVGRNRDHRPDAAFAQVVTDGAGGVRLVRQDHVRPGPRPSAAAGNAQAGHHVRESGCVTSLSGGENEREGPAAGICDEMNLRAQPAAGPAYGMVGRFSGWGPFLRAPAACW